MGPRRNECGVLAAGKYPLSSVKIGMAPKTTREVLVEPYRDLGLVLGGPRGRASESVPKRFDSQYEFEVWAKTFA